MYSRLDCVKAILTSKIFCRGFSNAPNILNFALANIIIANIKVILKTIVQGWSISLHCKQ